MAHDPIRRGGNGNAKGRHGGEIHVHRRAHKLDPKKSDVCPVGTAVGGLVI